MSYTQMMVKKPNGWHLMWEEKKIGWDKGKPSPALVSLLMEEGVIPTHGSVLVPGCGSGYDVFLFATRSKEHKAYGLDISPTACKVAAESIPNYPIDASQVEFIAGNFFECSFPTLFDIVYDYTFFCAIEPEMRPKWGQRMSEIIKSGGLLITLMFPIGTHTDGPPFAVQVEHYHTMLDTWFDRILLKDVTESHPGREGQEKIAVWKRK